MPMTYEQAQRIKFNRTVRHDTHTGVQTNTAVCTVCLEVLWTEGDIDGVTGIGELNRQVATHRWQHRAYDTPPHAPRRDV